MTRKGVVSAMWQSPFAIEWHTSDSLMSNESLSGLGGRVNRSGLGAMPVGRALRGPHVPLS